MRSRSWKEIEELVEELFELHECLGRLQPRYAKYRSSVGTAIFEIYELRGQVGQLRYRVGRHRARKTTQKRKAKE